ncbi:MAG: hypothetical protein KC776_41225 [Myxococcales bacterium]|nr:hypothetical protein [Myxococcales bacterium]MCB9576993.1 hypothetical protein [Polyangiaceae bacterium]
MRQNGWVWSAGAVVLFLSGCSSGAGGGSGNGSCANFAGTHKGSLTCSDGSTIPIDSVYTQSGCTVTSTSNLDNSVKTYTADGSTMTRQVNEGGVTGTCSETVSNGVPSFSCDLSHQGQAVTCNGTGTFTPAAPGSGGSPGFGGSSGSGGTPGGGGDGSCGYSWGSGDGSCDACMASTCCAQMSSCGPGSACASLIECFSSKCPGGDQSCVETQCGEQLAAGGQDLANLFACNQMLCNSCGTSSGGGA